MFCSLNVRISPSKLKQNLHIVPMLEHRIELLMKLRSYMLGQAPEWLEAQELAERQNAWFTAEFIAHAIHSICTSYLDPVALPEFAAKFTVQTENVKTVGVVMAGNIPLVGFHDFLCVFLSPHKMRLKLSTRDTVLMKHLIDRLMEWDPSMSERIVCSDMLKQCDAYIATGSNTSAGYFDYYFGRYPHIIRRNRTSVAVLDGTETPDELDLLADDVYLYFGLGCRNVTKLYVPENYSFEPLLQHFRKYDHLKDHNKYRNNLDYQLALYILNGQYYMSNDSLLLTENESLFSPVSVLHIARYQQVEEVRSQLNGHTDVQAIAGHGFIPFGQLQTPALTDFADGVNTLSFLNSL